MKKLIIGLVIGLILGMSTNAFAAIGDSVTAVFAKFNYVVNTEPKSLDSPVLVYEGVSYVRTTDISNMLGYDLTYKADSRTIEFNKPEPTTQAMVPNKVVDLTPEPSLKQTTVPVATPLPSTSPSETAQSTNTEVSAPNNEPTPSTEPTPVATASPSPTPTPVATVAPTPVPSNVAACQAIRDNYAGQIGMAAYEGLAQGPYLLRVHVLEYNRDQALSSAGC